MLPGARSPLPPDEARHTLELCSQARERFAIDRIRLGSFLCVIREHALWKGSAESWEEYLAAEGINAHAARQYITVARKFVFELGLDEEALSKLSRAGVTALEKAGRVITQQNKTQVLGILGSLAERDAVQAIIELGNSRPAAADQVNLRVIRLFREFLELPPDLQEDFKTRIAKRTAPAAEGGGV